MKERPILMQGEMVRASMREEHPKSQTRRKCQARTQAQADIIAAALMEDMNGADDGRHERAAWERIGCPYGVAGDRLWVRETWMPCDTLPQGDEPKVQILYKATNDVRPDGVSIEDFKAAEWFSRPWEEVDQYRSDIERMDVCGERWRPSIHLPRWASRLLLEIVSVRLQRLQEISEADAWAEGCIRGEPWENGKGWFPAERVVPGPKGHADGWDNAREWFLDLFAEINDGDSWNDNPFVWVIEFKRVEGVA